MIRHTNFASVHGHTWAHVTVSMLSAMISRVCNENRIPSPPMVMASDTPGKAHFSDHMLNLVILPERTYGVELPFAVSVFAFQATCDW